MLPWILCGCLGTQWGIAAHGGFVPLRRVRVGHVSLLYPWWGEILSLELGGISSVRGVPQISVLVREVG